MNNYRMIEVKIEDIEEDRYYGKEFNNMVINVVRKHSKGKTNIVPAKHTVDILNKYNLVPHVIIDISNKVQGIIAILFTHNYKGIKSEGIPLRVIGLVHAIDREVIRGAIEEMQRTRSEIIYEPSKEEYFFYKNLGIKVIGGF